MCEQLKICTYEARSPSRVVQWLQGALHCGTLWWITAVRGILDRNDIISHLVHIFLRFLCHVELLQGGHEGLPVAVLEVVGVCDVCQTACLVQCIL